ncbi:MAG: energy transducer TonB [Filimonas sp.]|nr:energy transducer TonB [Filimonas sp.]
MNANNIPSADILDIIFEGKNKSYGAYDLRKTYNKRVVLALSGTIAFCLLFFLSMAFENRKKATVEMPLVKDIILVSQPQKEKPPVEIPKEQPQQQQIQQTIRVTVPVIAPDEEVTPEDQIKTVDEMENIKIGVADTPGEKGDLVGPPTPETKGTGLGCGMKANEGLPNGNGFIPVQKEATFPGGLSEWRKFLERNLNSSVPVDNGAPTNTYTVLVSFVVDSEGNVSEIKAENDPGFGTAQEAIRVIKKSKKWIPALQNGKYVTYRQKQAISFKVNEE